jgi:hypothetical protein
MRWMKFVPRLCWAAVLSAGLTTYGAGSAGLRAMSVSELVEAADLILLGRVQSVRQVGDSTIFLNGQQIPATMMQGEIVVERALKGDPGLDRVVFHFSMPNAENGGIGYADVPNETQRLIFLSKSDRDYGFTNPYRPSLPTVPGITIQGQTSLERVISELAGVMHARESSRAEKLEAVFASQGVKSKTLDKALQDALMTTDRVLQLSVAAAMLARNDIAALPVAADALIHPSPSLPTYLFQNLSSSIARGVRDEGAIPTLAELLRKAPDAEARRAAASALRDIGTQTATAPLGLALGDNDFEVRYFAVIGLAEITGQSDWRPLMEEFQVHEEKYLAHWRDWSRSNRLRSTN